MARRPDDEAERDAPEAGSGSGGGVQSVEVGMRLLATLAEAGGEKGLNALAAAAGMPPAKAHRYLVSLTRTGFVEQDPATGRYALGGQAVWVGLVALGRADIVQAASSAIAALRDEIDETVLLAVWGTHGPTIVRWAEASRPVTVNVRVGSAMPLLRSATGRIFAAFAPPSLVAPLLDAELANLAEAPGRALPPDLPRDRAQAERLMAETRARGLGHVDGHFLFGVASLSAPVFDHEGRIAAALATLGPSGSFDDRLDGPVAAALRRAAQRVSLRLGYTGSGLPLDCGGKDSL
jgi:DNA-binding IclR family transcriptional regulator